MKALIEELGVGVALRLRGPDNSSVGPLRPKAADAAVAESTKLRREMLCIMHSTGQRAERPERYTPPASVVPQCAKKYLRCAEGYSAATAGRSLFDFLKLRLEPALEQPVERSR